MRHENTGRRPGRPGHAQRAKAVLEIRSRNRVEGAEWLVEEQQRGRSGESARDRNALSLPSGERSRPAVAEDGRLEADHPKRFVPPLSDPRRRTLQSQYELDVPRDGPVRQETTVLRHVSDPAAQRDQVCRRQVVRLDEDSAGIGPDESVEAPKQGGLAGTALANEGHALANSDVQAQGIEGEGLPVAFDERLGGKRRRAPANQCCWRVLNQSGRATQSSKLRPLQVVFALSITLR